MSLTARRATEVTISPSPRAELERRVDGEVRFDAGSRAAFAVDSSNYRQPPVAVVAPRTIEAAVDTIAVCAELGVPVLLRPDTVSNHVHPHVARAAVVGMVLVLKPPCMAMLRSDGPELLTERAHDPTPPQFVDDAIVQTHCHQHAIMGVDADSELMSNAGVHADRLGSGCCRLAGNFVFEAGHYEVPRASGERVLMPRVRQSGLALTCGRATRNRGSRAALGQR